ncbi:ERECTA-like kinase [Planoprotostelium fungivorum]|uniref:ERECTA-like kinase n=1 Tax=Planoprotostelium fungivorum TaxID=1890364 RepID=A0A2P6NX16_9EUKA|nr:ERECTA-like kinase [Planoprotostelium fungivorum]
MTAVISDAKTEVDVLFKEITVCHMSLDNCPFPKERKSVFPLRHKLVRAQRQMQPRIVILYVLFVSVLHTNGDTLQVLRELWTSFNVCFLGSQDYWIGTDFCNASDFIGLTCAVGEVTSITLSAPTISNGTIAFIIGNLTMLTSLSLQGVGLTGSIPESVSSLIQLTNLNLRNNQLTGFIPDLSDLKSLEILNLGDNRLSGSIPAWIGQSKRLRTVELSSNHLNGSLPDMTQLTSLLSFSAGTNQLNSSLDTLCSLQSLDHLDLRHNLITGSIPNCISSWNNISYLDLSYNSISGNVPPITSRRLRWLDLSNNIIDSLGQDCLPTDIPDNYFCNLQYNNFPCFPAQKSLTCYITCSNSITQSQTYLETATIAPELLPGVIASITQNLLSQSNPSFQISTKNVSLFVNTFTMSTVESITLSLPHSDLSALIPRSVVDLPKVTVSISSIAFNPFESIDGTITYGKVVGVTLYDTYGQLKVNDTLDHITINMGPLPLLPSNFTPTCLYWNEISRKWAADGCNTSIYNETISCLCHHLTNFTIGAPPPDVTPIPSSPASNGASHNLIIVSVCVVVGVLLLASAITVSLIFYLRIRRARGKNRKSVILSTDMTEKINYTKLIYEGNGQVWQAIYNGTTVVAVKKLEEEKLMAELSAIRKLHHPNIVMFVGDDIAEGCIVTEWMSEGDLHETLNRTPLHTRAILKIASDVTNGLYYLESVNMFHSCITPRKVLMKYEGSEYVAKLGGASHIVKLDSTVPARTLCGAHTAPEIPSCRKYEKTCHVWSFGVLLWSITHNRTDIYDMDAQERISGLIAKGERIFKTNPSIDDRLLFLINQCTRGDPEMRPSLGDITKRLLTARRTDSQPSAFRSEEPSADNYGIIEDLARACALLSMPCGPLVTLTENFALTDDWQTFTLSERHLFIFFLFYFLSVPYHADDEVPAPGLQCQPHHIVSASMRSEANRVKTFIRATSSLTPLTGLSLRSNAVTTVRMWPLKIIMQGPCVPFPFLEAVQN